MKTLVVCLSSDLPFYTLRDSNTIYYVYNKLVVYNGQVPYTSPYSIVDGMPENPVGNLLYIDVSDGTVKIFDDYTVVTIATVGSEEMLDVLKQANTILYYDSKEQYIDKTTRMLVIPYTNGVYNLVVDIPGDLLYNENTITKYNPDTGQFEIYGETFNEDPLETSGWHGHETDTVNVVANDGTIVANAKISKADNNIIRALSDGLYAYPHNAITQEEFDSWKSSYEEYKSLLEYYLNIINEALEDAQGMINPEVIDKKIKDTLDTMYPVIDEAIANYEQLSEKVDELFEYAQEYSTEKMAAAVEYLEDLVNEALAHPWGDLPEGSEDDEEEGGEDDTEG